MNHSDLSGLSGRRDQIKNELAKLFHEQAEFYRKGGRSRHTKDDIAEFEKRRERVRALFRELEQK